MANAFQSIASGAGILKNYYHGPMVDNLNETLPIYRAAEKIKEGWSGLQINRPLRLKRNQGIGATTDGGALPDIGNQGTQQAVITAKYNYLRFGVTGPMIKASASDIGSFVRSVSFELEYGYKDLRADINRQLYWNGDGKLAALSANAVASQSITIEGRESSSPALQFIDSGMAIDIYSTAGALKASGVTISSITSGGPNSSTAVLLLDQPVTAVATDIIVRSGSYNNEVNGLLYALDGLTTTIYNINRATYQAYQGNVLDQSAAQLTLSGMQGAWNQGLRRGNVGKYNAILCDFTSLNYYQKLLTPDKRYTNTTSGDGSFGSKGEFYLNFNGVPCVPDQSAPTRFFFLPSEVLKLYVLAEMDYADESGSYMIAQVDNDEYEVRIRHFLNLFNDQPAACAVVSNYISP